MDLAVMWIVLNILTLGMEISGEEINSIARYHSRVSVLRDFSAFSILYVAIFYCMKI